MKNTKHTSKKRTQRDYTMAFKLSVVEQVERGDLTYKQAQDRYGIQGCSTVLVWLRKHGKFDWSPKEAPPVIKQNETPAQTIKRLEKELEEERLRSLLLNEMVDVMDEQYGTDIKKKLSSIGLKGFKRRNK